MNIVRYQLLESKNVQIRDTEYSGGCQGLGSDSKGNEEMLVKRYKLSVMSSSRTLMYIMVIIVTRVLCTWISLGWHLRLEWGYIHRKTMAMKNKNIVIDISFIYSCICFSVYTLIGDPFDAKNSQ